MEELITQYCKTLRIGKGFYQGYKDIQSETHDEFLLELLRREVENRETARKNRLDPLILEIMLPKILVL